MKRCFIFSAGSFYGLYEKPNREDLIIAADAGLLLCQKLGIKPNYVIGDFDSLEETPDTAAEIIKLPVEKDDTDTMYALKFALEKGCDYFCLYGTTGGERPDHSIASLQTLAYLKRHKGRGLLYDKNFVWTVIENESIEITKKRENGIVSVFAIGSEVKGVSLKGLQYPLSDAFLSPSYPLGVSNHIMEDTAVISCKEGLLLVGVEL